MEYEKIYAQIVNELMLHSSTQAKASVATFIPGEIESMGVRMPVVNEMAKKYREYCFDILHLLWNSGVHEQKILAAKILEQISNKDPQRAMLLVKEFSKTITNWAVCDTLGMQSLRKLRSKYADDIFEIAKELNTSANLWQRRLSLVIVEWYTRDASRHKALLNLIKPLKNDSEYYVKKAIAWIERNMQKV